MRQEFNLVDSNKKLATEINNAVTRALLGLLGIVFVTLKLTGFIDWSWWWVTLPFWGGLALAGCIILIVAVVGLFIGGAVASGKSVAAVKRKIRNRRNK